MFEHRDENEIKPCRLCFVIHNLQRCVSAICPTPPSLERPEIRIEMHWTHKENSSTYNTTLRLGLDV